MSRRRPTFVAYVSGHGYGHATRSSEVLRELLRQFPAARVHVRTMAPPWLFRSLDARRVSVDAVATDVGVVQIDGLRFRLDATLEALAGLERELPSLARRETRFLVKTRPDAVISDISPFPLAWAAEAGFPALGLGNFSWDDIYRGFARRVARFDRYADLFARAASKAHALLRLPFAMPMASFRTIVDVPLVVRASSVEPAAVRAALRAGKRPLVLLSFGGFDVRSLPLESLARLPRYLFVVASPLAARPSANVRVVSGRDIDHVALVRASDVVLGKPGYGLVSEVTAYERRIVFTTRGPFPEYKVLAAALRATGQAVFCPRRALASGAIGPYLERALALPAVSRRPRARDGALVAARIIARHAGLT